MTIARPAELYCLNDPELMSAGLDIRPDAAQLGELYTMVSPNYRAVLESYQKAQSVVRSTPDSATAAARL